MGVKSTFGYAEIEVLRKYPRSYDQQSFRYLGLNDKSKVYAGNTDLKTSNKYTVIEAMIMEGYFPRKGYSKRGGSKMQFLETSSLKAFDSCFSKTRVPKILYGAEQRATVLPSKPNMSYFFRLSLQ